MRGWYDIRAKAEVSEIWLYEEIGIWGIGAKEFIAELHGITSPKIDLHINSPGGEVFEGNAVYNALKRHAAEITTYIDGIAASIASVIALAGTKVVMAENAMYMMHNPSGLVYGPAEDMRKTANILDKIRDTMVGVYQAKSGKTDAEVKALLDAETWFDAQEAKEAGFVDAVGDAIEAVACSQFVPTMAKLGFRHVPKTLTARETPPARDLERALRDAGCSSIAAKTILARGLTDALRDGGQSAPATAAAVPPRDVAPPPAARRDRVADLLDRAELVAPTPR